METPKTPWEECSLTTEWEPGEEDLAHVRGVIRLLKEGGIWKWVNDPLTYQLSHTDKTARLTAGDIFSENSLRTIKVFNALGWSVILPVQKGDIN